MKAFLRIWLIGLVTGCSLPALYAQHPGSYYPTLESLLESLAEEMEGEDAASARMEELQEKSDHPVNLNTASAEELLEIPLVTAATASAIISYREKYGSFFSSFELASVPGVGRDLAEKIGFFAYAGDQADVASKDSATRSPGFHRLLLRGWRTFPAGEEYLGSGDQSADYPGSAMKLFTRYSYENPGRIKAGLTAEKDPGEPFFKGHNNTGFDFYSAHISMKIHDRIPFVILGDYTVMSGQGLVLWQGFSPGRSADILQVSRNLSRIRPYTSTDENRFFRGMAVTFRSKQSSLNLFFSSKKSDGNLTLTPDSLTVFTSLQSSGYHRTLSEIADKKSVRHTVAGGFFSVARNQFKGGVTGLWEQFGYPWIPGDQMYEKYLFRGTRNFTLGCDYRWVTGPWQFSGEGALSRSGGKAFVQTVEARLHDQLQWVFLFRHFGRNYHATWANAFGGSDRVNNETGLYSGMKILPAAGLTFSAYADLFRSSWLRYTTSSPSEGYEITGQADCRISRRISGYVRLKTKNSQGKTAGEHMPATIRETKSNLRFHATAEISREWIVHARVETLWGEVPAAEKGILTFADLAWTPQDFPVSALLRLTGFHTDSYQSRIYTFENDLLYVFSVPAFYGHGFRVFLNTKWSLSNHLEAWIKAGYTHQSGEGSPGEETGFVSETSKSEVKIQLRYRY